MVLPEVLSSKAIYIFCFLLTDSAEDGTHTLMSSSTDYNKPISNLGLFVNPLW